MSHGHRRRILFKNVSRSGRHVDIDRFAGGGFGEEIVRYRGQLFRFPLGLRGIALTPRTTGTIGGRSRA